MSITIETTLNKQHRFVNTSGWGFDTFLEGHLKEGEKQRIRLQRRHGEVRRLKKAYDTHMSQPDDRAVYGQLVATYTSLFSDAETAQQQTEVLERLQPPRSFNHFQELIGSLASSVHMDVLTYAHQKVPELMLRSSDICLIGPVTLDSLVDARIEDYNPALHFSMPSPNLYINLLEPHPFLMPFVGEERNLLGIHISDARLIAEEFQSVYDQVLPHVPLTELSNFNFEEGIEQAGAETADQGHITDGSQITLYYEHKGKCNKITGFLDATNLRYMTFNYHGEQHWIHTETRKYSHQTALPDGTTVVEHDLPLSGIPGHGAFPRIVKLKTNLADFFGAEETERVDGQEEYVIRVPRRKRAGTRRVEVTRKYFVMYCPEKTVAENETKPADESSLTEQFMVKPHMQRYHPASGTIVRYKNAYRKGPADGPWRSPADRRLYEKVQRENALLRKHIKK